MPKELKTISIIFFLVGFGLFGLLNFVPIMTSFLISFQEFSPFGGIFDSPWIGLHNFYALSGFTSVAGLFINSSLFSLTSAVMATLISLPIAVILGNMKRGKLRSLLTFALLLPAFIPGSILAMSGTYSIISHVVVDSGPLRMSMILLGTIRPVAIFSFVGANAAGLYKDKGMSSFSGAVSGIIIAAAVSLVRFLSSDLDFHNLFHVSIFSPRGIPITETFDTFIFRIGFQQLRFSIVSAAWLLKTVMQMLMAIFAFIIIILCMRSTSRPVTDSDTGEDNSSIFTFLSSFVGIIAVFVFIVCLVLAFGSATASSSHSYALGSAIFNNVIVTVISGFLFVGLLFFLTFWYSININSKLALLLILMLATVANNMVGEFIFFRNLGIVNTHIAPALANDFNWLFVISATYLASLKIQKPDSFGKLVSALLPYLAVFSGVFISNVWGNSFNYMLHVNSHANWGLALWTTYFDSDISFTFWIVVPVILISLITGLVFVLTNKNHDS